VTAFPKPVKRPKKPRQPLRRTRMRPGARRSAVKKAAQNIPQLFPKPEPKRGTKHSRREREWGRMAWLHSSKLCFVWGFFATAWEKNDPESEIIRAVERGGTFTAHEAMSIFSRCEGELQVMHLGPRKGYRAPDNQTALGCRRHHEDIDQARSWFRCLTIAQRAAFELYLYRKATAAWLALPPEERAAWDARAAAERLSSRRGDR
jgi:hypothetical protein